MPREAFFVTYLWTTLDKGIPELLIVNEKVTDRDRPTD